MDAVCTEECLLSLASSGFDWKSVGYQLLGLQGTTDIDHSEQTELHKRQKVLLSWLQKEGSNATKAALAKVLRELKHWKLVQKLEGKGNSMLKGIDSERELHPNKTPGESFCELKCKCKKCDLWKLIHEGCPSFRDSQNPFPTLNFGVLNENDIKELQQTLYEQGQKMWNEYDKIKNHFVSLMEAVSFRNFKATVRGISGYNGYTNLGGTFHDRRDEIKAANTHEELMTILEDYITWFNCNLLKAIVERCNDMNREDKEKFTESFELYEKELNSYCEKGVFECTGCTFSEKRQKNPPSKLFCLLVDENKIKDIYQLHHFEGELIKKLGLRKYHLKLCYVGQGCIELIYLLPTCVHKVLFPLSSEQLLGLVALGVTDVYSEGPTMPELRYESIGTLLQKVYAAPANLATCEKEFNLLVKKCRCLKLLSVEKLIHCVTEVPDKPDYRDYMIKHNIFKECTTVGKFIDSICTYMFYHLFKKVVATYGDEKLKDDMRKYEERLTSITTLIRAKELPITKAYINDDSTEREVAIKFGIPIANCRMSDIQSLRDVLQIASYMFEFCHRFHEISGDSTTTTIKWLISSAYSRHLQVELLLNAIPAREAVTPHISTDMSQWSMSDAIENTEARGTTMSKLVAYGVLEIIVDGICVHMHDQETMVLKRGILSQSVTVESQPDYLKQPDDLSFRPSNISRALEAFSREQWDEFALTIGFSLQDIADCWADRSSNHNYQNTLLRRWLSSDYSTSWYTVVMAVKAMLPPANDCSKEIVERYPNIVEDNEKQLKEIKKIIPAHPQIVRRSQNIEIEVMDVDDAVMNVATTVDQRFRDIQEVLQASHEELKQKSNSEEYWRKQEDLDNAVIQAMNEQDVEIDRFIQRTNELCEDVTRHLIELDRSVLQAQDQCQKVQDIHHRTKLKGFLFEELNEQLDRLNKLKSQNEDRIAELVKIPSLTIRLIEDAARNVDLCEEAKRKVQLKIEKHLRLIRNTENLVSQNTDRLNKLATDMDQMLQKWDNFFFSTLFGAAVGAGLGVLGAVGLSLITAGMLAPLATTIAAGAAVGAGAGATVGGMYGWNTYKSKGRRNMEIFSEQARESKMRCIDLNHKGEEIEKLIHSY